MMENAEYNQAMRADAYGMYQTYKKDNDRRTCRGPSCMNECKSNYCSEKCRLSARRKHLGRR